MHQVLAADDGQGVKGAEADDSISQLKETTKISVAQLDVEVGKAGDDDGGDDVLDSELAGARAVAEAQDALGRLSSLLTGFDNFSTEDQALALELLAGLAS